MEYDVTISEWGDSHPRWPEVIRFFGDHEDSYAELIPGYDQRDSRILVATIGETLAGILRLIVIPIGPEDGLPAVQFHGGEVQQAKVMNFTVLPEFRRRGVGTRLQEAAIRMAKSLSCYQLASFSDDGLTANHMLKLRMGFAVHPVALGNAGRHGLHFIMPLAEPR